MPLESQVLAWDGQAHNVAEFKPVNGIATPPFDNLISNANTYVNKRKKTLLSCLNMYVIPTEIYEYMKVNSATQILVINCAVNSGNDNTYIW